MSNERLETQEDKIPAYDILKLNKTIECVQKLQRLNEEEKKCSLIEFLYYQLKFISKKVWALQMGILILFIIVFQYVYIDSNAYGVICAIFVPVIVVTGMAEICRNIYGRMIEIENTTYFNIRKVVVARLLIVGMIDLLIITLMLVMMCHTQVVPIKALILYILIPLNSTSCIYFLILHKCRGYITQLSCATICILWSMGLVVLTKYQNIYERVQTSVWVVLIILSSAYLCYVVKELLGTKKYMERYLLCKSEWV